MKKLHRSDKDSVIFGVCGGLGQYFEIDPTIFRILFIALLFGGGTGILIYIILAIILPDSDDKEEFALDKRVSNLTSEFKTVAEQGRNRTLLGWAIVVVGLLLLLNTVLPWTIFNWGVFWALVVIGLGVLVLSGRGGVEGVEERIEKAGQEIEEKFEKIAKEEEEKSDNKKSSGFDVFGIFFGLLLLAAGMALLLNNLGLFPAHISFDVGDIIHLWPVLLILLGLSFFSEGSVFSRIVVLIVTVVIAAFVIIALFFPQVGPVERQSFSVPIEEGVTESEMAISLGAGRLYINGGGEDFLVEGGYEASRSTLYVDSGFQDGVQVVDLSTGKSPGNRFDFLRSDPRFLEMRVSEDVPVSFSVDSGASRIKIDTSDLIVHNLSLNAGASSIELVLGKKADHIDVVVEAGVSSIDLTIPEGLGTQLEFSGALSNRNIRGFTRTEDGVYETDDFRRALNTASVRINSAVSNIQVNRG